jgi:hypothetical protein
MTCAAVMLAQLAGRARWRIAPVLPSIHFFTQPRRRVANPTTQHEGRMP